MPLSDSACPRRTGPGSSWGNPVSEGESDTGMLHTCTMRVSIRLRVQHRPVAVAVAVPVAVAVAGECVLVEVSRFHDMRVEGSLNDQLARRGSSLR